ncbi:hypothetical protein HMPREF9162_1220 [Selenomonas sp. oral taxon 137 str. F0430]|nr:hypothetical protein HMPREF9162_1220 [Selenomonas sp. oral taxon 137 str. F0430]
MFGRTRREIFLLQMKKASRIGGTLLLFRRTIFSAIVRA